MMPRVEIEICGRHVWTCMNSCMILRDAMCAGNCTEYGREYELLAFLRSTAYAYAYAVPP